MQAVADASVVGIDGDGEPRGLTAAKEDEVRARGHDGVARKAEVIAERPRVAQPPTGEGDGYGTGVVQLDELVFVGVVPAISIGVAGRARRRVGEHLADEEGIGDDRPRVRGVSGREGSLGRRGGFVRDQRAARRWDADERLVFGPIVVRDDGDLVAVDVGQADFLAFVGQAVANAPVVGIDGGREARWRAAAKEDDVRMPGDCRAGRELEVGVQRLAVAQPPASQGDGNRPGVV